MIRGGRDRTTPLRGLLRAREERGHGVVVLGREVPPLRLRGAQALLDVLALPCRIKHRQYGVLEGILLA